jgi:2-C-methyl-D-erythritol 4-phosphate cytidylyltransferase
MSANSEKMWAVVPAAGVGSRLGGKIPKQYLDINGKKIIEHILERLASHPRIMGIVVAISGQDRYWGNIAIPQDTTVIHVEGGAERHHSVLNALAKLSQFIQGDDWVLVHDAARPCIRHEDIDKLIAAVITHPVGGILGVPTADTMKRVDEHLQIVTTVNRSGLWHAQTPQMFRLEQLIDAIRYAIDTGASITDEASALELRGLSPLVIEGHRDNIKITEQQDLIHAAMYMVAQAEGVSA